jgi:hypothetical protein
MQTTEYRVRPLTAQRVLLRRSTRQIGTTVVGVSRGQRIVF